MTKQEFQALDEGALHRAFFARFPGVDLGAVLHGLTDHPDSFGLLRELARRDREESLPGDLRFSPEVTA